MANQQVKIIFFIVIAITSTLAITIQFGLAGKNLYVVLLFVIIHILFKRTENWLPKPDDKFLAFYFCYSSLFSSH
jgi:hypothetical protein